MNALWLERITAYKNTPLASQSALALVAYKITRQNTLLKKYHAPVFEIKDTPQTIEKILLFEARAAKHFWKQFKTILPQWSEFHSRRAHGDDITNKLLDIGYHHLVNVVQKILLAHAVTLAPALIHVAHTEKSSPLVYDLMELFRSDIVDTQVLKTLHLKKKPLTHLTQKDIAIFVHALNARLEIVYFIRDFSQCHTYKYYMELQIIKYIKAINHKEVFTPLHLPTRHDTRCACKK